jgi:alanine dehydrogenase
MIIGVLREIKEGEERVALTPTGAKALVGNGHTVLVEKDAGEFCGFPDGDYAAAGATISSGAAELWGTAELILKVKEPLEEEFDYLRPGLSMFAFLHLAATPELARRLVEQRVTAIAYETVRLEDGTLPVLAPMSEVAGYIAVQHGAYFLEARNGGRGVLLQAISGSPAGTVTVIGGGVAGTNACRMASAMGANVTVLDASIKRLDHLRDIFGVRVATALSSPAAVEECLTVSDVVIGAVLIPGQRAPRLITKQMVEGMRRGSVFIDISIDQGGISETGRTTTHEDPVYVESGVLHSCIPNMPAAVPRSSTLALTARTLPYTMEMADKGVEKALADSPALREGLNVRDGEITHPGVKATLTL